MSIKVNYKLSNGIATSITANNLQTEIKVVNEMIIATKEEQLNAVLHESLVLDATNPSNGIAHLCKFY